MSPTEVHCVPMAAVVMNACMLWLRDTRRLHTASVCAAMTLGFDEVECLLLVLHPLHDQDERVSGLCGGTAAKPTVRAGWWLLLYRLHRGCCRRQLGGWIYLDDPRREGWRCRRSGSMGAREGANTRFAFVGSRQVASRGGRRYSQQGRQ